MPKLNERNQIIYTFKIHNLKQCITVPPWLNYVWIKSASLLSLMLQSLEAASLKYTEICSILSFGVESSLSA